MSDNNEIVSLDAFRERQEEEVSRKDREETEEVISFLFSGDSKHRLDELYTRLNAPSRGAVISTAMDILRLCLDKMEEGCEIIAVDEDGNGSIFFVDPHYRKDPKTPA